MLSLQYVESKYVRATVPAPALPSPHATGSSAPLSVDTTSTRWMLMPHHRSPKGAVARNASTNACASAWYLAISVLRYPSPRITML
jgi:hypothetical protein